MFTLLFALYAVAQLALFVWLWRTWRETRTPSAAVLLVPQLGLFWDNLVVASGKFIGLGPTLIALSWPRFWIHWLMGAWLIVASGSILRLAGFEFAKRRWVMVTFCLLTAAMMVWDIPYFFEKQLHPVCEYDLVRYSTAVKDGAQCLPGQAAVPGGGAPIPQLMAIAAVLFAGALLWRYRGFPWYFLGGALMYISATPPFQRLKLDNFGEVLIAGGAIWAIWHFTRPHVRARWGGPSAGR
jgi:hypothetical protein